MTDLPIKPFITAMIPTYRRPNLLRRAIRSVLNQTYPHLQVCVYDNSSGDETASVVAEFMRTDGRVKYHCHPTNIGAFNNFTYGIERVGTPCFSLLSDDDLLLPDFYREAIEGLHQHPEAIFFAGETLRVDEKGRILAAFLSSWPREGFFHPHESLPFIQGVRHPTWTAIVFRREIIEKVGVLDPEVGAPLDLDLLFHAAALFPIVISKKPCAIFVHHPSAGNELAGMNSLWPGWLKMMRNLKADERIPPSLRVQSEVLLTKLFRITVLVQAVRCIRREDFKEAHRAAELLYKNDQIKKRALWFALFIKLLCYVRPARHLFFSSAEILIYFRNLYFRRKYPDHHEILNLL
jgi:glycosyltransferase involved in cell wall biosynthesis